jgi:molybdopterin-guanine dinucleotide biosynthesis protein A
VTLPDLYIVAAGKGSRLAANVPKALVPIADEPCLTTTLQQIGRKFRRVFVVTNILLCDQWRTYFHNLEIGYPELAEQVVNLPIESGLGDGHATLNGFQAAESIEDGTLSQDVVVAWGDVFFPKSEIIDELVSNTLGGSGLLPAVYETNPYVSLVVDEQMRCAGAEFSKYGERCAAGFHDQSVFRFSRSRLQTSLRHLHSALWKNGRYITPNGELSLLYTLHELYNSAEPAYVYETIYPTLAFNTVEEVAAVQKQITGKWKIERRRDRSVAMPREIVKQVTDAAGNV